MKKKRLKLIWDFKGPDAENTARHHAHHLNQFAFNENLELVNTDIEKIGEEHFISYMIVMQKEVLKIRDILKPQRAQYTTE